MLSETGLQEEINKVPRFPG